VVKYKSIKFIGLNDLTPKIPQNPKWVAGT
jgi:hypothetical protein